MQSQMPTFFRGVWIMFYHDAGWMTGGTMIAKLWVKVIGPFA